MSRGGVYIALEAAAAMTRKGRGGDAAMSNEETFVERLRALATNDLSDWMARELQPDLADAADRIEALEAELAAERALADQLADALDRTLRALRLVLSSKPCRDVAETEGEALRAQGAHRAARTPTKEDKT